MKSVLIIAYYFPPMGSSGVQRPLKFVKYLPEYGWKPVVLAPQPGAYHTFDYSLEKELEHIDCEIHRIPVKTPFHLTGGAPKQVDFIPERLEKIMRWISAFFWLPDNKKGWIKPAVTYAGKLIREQNIDTVFATAPPYSNLVILRELKKKMNIKAVADLRDDWLENHQIIYPSPLHKSWMKQIELNCLHAADQIVVLNDAVKASIENRVNTRKTIQVIPNGYDRQDFEAKGLEREESISGSKIKFLYSGRFYDKQQPDIFLKAIHYFLQTHPEYANQIELQFQGGLSETHHQVIQALDLQHLVKNFGYVAHQTAIKNMMNADILWLTLGYGDKAAGVVPGKLFEYFATHKPILGLVPDGEAKKLIQKYGCSFIGNPDDIMSVQQKIQVIVTRWQQNRFEKVNSKFVKLFERKELTGEISKIFNRL